MQAIAHKILNLILKNHLKDFYSEWFVKKNVNLKNKWLSPDEVETKDGKKYHEKGNSNKK